MKVKNNTSHLEVMHLGMSMSIHGYR